MLTRPRPLATGWSGNRHVGGALEKIPTAARYYITLDMDGLDPSIAPLLASVRSLGEWVPEPGQPRRVAVTA